jgi:hypothetical protein
MGAPVTKKTVEVPSGEAKARKAARQRAVDLALGTCKLWHGREDGPPQAFASFERDGHTEHVALRSPAGRLWLQGLVWHNTGEALSRQDTDGAMDALEAAAVHDGPRYPVRVRVADLGDRIFLDLADDDWRVAEVTPEGWRVIPQGGAPVRFRRPDATEALPVPVPDGDLAELGHFIHAGAEALSLAAAWTVSAITDRGPQAILSLQGPQGSSKSTTGRILQALVDPRRAVNRGRPKDDQALASAARNAWCLSYDNLSGLSPELADSLCRLATGGAITARRLYSDADETVIEARRPVILSSITDLSGRPDLRDRSVFVTLDPIGEDERLSEQAFWKRFEEARPRLLGALLDSLSLALRRLPAILEAGSLDRMADAHAVMRAASPALPGGEETFRRAWEGMREGAVAGALEASPLAQALLPLLQARKGWRNPAGALLRELNASRAVGIREHSTWPQSPRGLVSAIQRLQPALRERGWIVQTGIRNEGTTGHERLVLIAPEEGIKERAGILEHDAGFTRAESERRAALEWMLEDAS